MKIINSEWFIDTFELRFSSIFVDLDYEFNGCSAGDILAQFRGFSNPTLSDLDRLTGSNSWSTMFCRECSGFQSSGVIFNNNWDADNLLFVCQDCLETAIFAIKERAMA